MKYIVLAVVLFCGIALAANPPQPQISTSYFAKLSVSVAEGRDYWRGGGEFYLLLPFPTPYFPFYSFTNNKSGIEALELDGGKARVDIKLDGNKGPRYIHVLDRYDMVTSLFLPLSVTLPLFTLSLSRHDSLLFKNLTFILDGDKCIKEKANGALKNPWAWIPSASYSGSSTYQGVPLDDWQYQSDGITMKISVLHSNPNVPVFFQTKSNTNNGTGTLSLLTFLPYTY
jgi:hypothetical protein